MIHYYYGKEFTVKIWQEPGVLIAEQLWTGNAKDLVFPLMKTDVTFRFFTVEYRGNVYEEPVTPVDVPKSGSIVLPLPEGKSLFGVA